MSMGREAMAIRLGWGAGEPPLGEDAGAAWFCLFRTADERGRFLERLRSIADWPPVPSAERDALRRLYGEEMARREQAGDSVGALLIRVRWWGEVMRRPCHAYKLKVAVPPFQSSCLLAFRELSTEEVHDLVGEALGVAEGRRSRVIDAFGLREPAPEDRAGDSEQAEERSTGA